MPDNGHIADLYSNDDGTGHQRWKILPSADPRYYNIVVFDGTKVDLCSEHSSNPLTVEQPVNFAGQATVALSPWYAFVQLVGES